MSEACSPDNFIDVSFYYMIASALQRRVWVGDVRNAIYPNLFVILCGPPGVGKGVVIKQVERILRHHKREKGQTILGVYKPETDEDKRMLAFDQSSNAAKDLASNKEDLLLIPVAANKTTLEKLINSMASSVRAFCYKKVDETGAVKLGHDMQSALCFCLEEIASLLKTQTHDTVNFLLQAYDCGDYRYETIKREEDMIKNSCLNFFGGATPAWLQRSFGQEILTEGFSSRCWFIYGERNRKEVLFVKNYTPEQIAAYEDILVHIKRLTTLHGKVTLTKEAEELLRNWWVNINPTQRPNKSSKLLSYYSRKNLHVIKLATGIHFADNYDMYINAAECQQALDFLARWEKDMHLALSVGQVNPLAKVVDDVLKFISMQGGETNKRTLLLEFFERLPNGEADLDQLLTELQTMNKVKPENGRWRIIK